MRFRLSDKISAVDDALITEIFKLADDPLVIPFGSGNPCPDLFPAALCDKIISGIFEKQPAAMMQYAASEGYAPLIATLKARLSAKYGIDFSHDNIFITSGAQQAIDLVAKCLLNEGDTVICEGLSYMSAMDAFRTYGARLIGVPLEDDGMDTAKLEEALKSHPDTKFIYIIPNFQNPTGITTSWEKRVKIYELAEKYDTVILEDDPYGEIRFSGRALDPIKSLDKSGRVVYCGTFSKVISPAFRVGFMCAHETFLTRIMTGKQCTDIHTTPLFQHICNEILTKYDYEGHLKKVTKLYSEKCALMLGEMEKKFHKDISFTRPEGGMFITVYLPDTTDSKPFVRKAIENGVAAVPGSCMLPRYGVSNAIRINFSTPTPQEIIKGIDILGRMTHEMLGS